MQPAAIRTTGRERAGLRKPLALRRDGAAGNLSGGKDGAPPAGRKLAHAAQGMSDWDAAPLARDAGSSSHGPGEKSFSEVLLVLLARRNGDLRMQDLLTFFRERSFGALMLIFAAPNILPLPPGVSTVLAIPLIIVSAQLALGFASVRLPAALAGLTLPKEWMAAAIARLVPWFGRIERVLSPSLPSLFSFVGERITGLLCLVLSILLFLPIPFTGIVPAAVLTLIAFGIVQKDGRAVIAGWIGSAVILTLFIYFFGYLLTATRMFWSAAFGG